MAIESDEPIHYFLVLQVIDLGVRMSGREPRMMQCFICRNPLARVLLHHLCQQTGQTGAKVLRNAQLTILDVRYQLQIGLARERQLTGHYLIDHDAEGPNVARIAVI